MNLNNTTDREQRLVVEDYTKIEDYTDHSNDFNECRRFISKVVSNMAAKPIMSGWSVKEQKRILNLYDWVLEPLKNGKFDETKLCIILNAFLETLHTEYGITFE